MKTNKAALLAMVEAVGTYAQTISSLMHRKLPGYENEPERLLRELIVGHIRSRTGADGQTQQITNNGFVANLASAAPAGEIGPRYASGLVFSEPILEKAEGKFSITRTVRDFFTRKRAQIMQNEVLNEASIYPSSDGLGAEEITEEIMSKLDQIDFTTFGPLTGMGCPLATVSGDKSMVQEFAEIFLEIFEQIDDDMIRSPCCYCSNDRLPIIEVDNMKPYQGSCLCGQVKYEVSCEFIKFFLCHCSRCRKISGTVHGANLFAKQFNLNWLQGEGNTQIYQVPNTRFKKRFCKTCSSTLPNVGDSGILLVPAGSLDSNVERPPDAHIFMKDKANWDDHLENISHYDEYQT